MKTHTDSKQVKHWQTQLDKAQCKDFAALQKTLIKVKNQPKSNHAQFEQRLNKSLAETAKREQNLPDISFPEALPVSARKEEIAKLIKQHQVLILAGQTGSGKTTQIPKICLSLGMGSRGLIGHTQPRRIAARTVANRIAAELQQKLGQAVGYQVRFKEVLSEQTYLKLMTDGVLLNEIQRDRNLSRYEVIIIDEAHERSLNIDFLLGLLKQVCQRRKDLKVIITSATIDVEKFSQHFNNAPIIEVSGRTYPVDVVYAPLDEHTKQALDINTAICDSVQNILEAESQGHYQAAGDILVFCSGEREIRDASKSLGQRNLPIDILPLYARLNQKEQNKVFEPAARRKVVLATNVAETSITVPGIGYVIDPGLARISRYSFRSKIQRLPIEKISQASANQRKGRCGRIANGICIRLYSEEDFAQRPEFTEAEILRSNLAAVILQMRQLGIKDIQQFPFIDQPDKRLIGDGFKLLHELNAVNPDNELTATGRQLSQLPVDPRYARILYEAKKLGCLHQAIIIIAGLSIQDPRERPTEHRQAADEKHRLTQHPQSDFLSLLSLWHQINKQRNQLSNSQFKQYCRQYYWSITRIFEWRDLVSQLKQAAKNLNWALNQLPNVEDVNTSPKQPHNTKHDQQYESVHRALVSGLLSHLAMRTIEGNYQAARGRSITPFPASTLAKLKKKPRWLIANELLETSKLFAHTCAHIQPSWVLDCAQHLVNYNYSSPHYHQRSGSIKAFRQTSLYGLILRSKERVNYGPLNPEESHQLFIQQALVEGGYSSKQHRPNFLQHNLELIEHVENLEHKARRRDLIVSDEQIYHFYKSAIPASVYNRRTFERWYKKASEKEPSLLFLNESQLLRASTSKPDVAQFPDHIKVQGLSIAVKYHFDPSHDNDGVTLELPIAVLQAFPMHIGDWLVPGLLHEKCIALIKTLPKAIRKQFAPAGQTVDRIFSYLSSCNQPLHQTLGQALLKTTGIDVPNTAWQTNTLDLFYQMNYRLIEQDGSTVTQSRDLAQLKQRYLNKVADSIKQESSSQRQQFERPNIQGWDVNQILERIDYQHEGMTVFAYSMFKTDLSGEVSLLLHEESDYARYYSQHGIEQLAIKQHKQSYQYLKKEILSNKTKSRDKLNLLLLPFFKNQQEVAAFRHNIITAALRESCFLDNYPRTKTQFEAAIKQGKANWIPKAIEIEKTVIQVFQQRYDLQRKINAFQSPNLAEDRVLEDIKEQVFMLFAPGFLNYTPLLQLKQYTRYLKTLAAMLEKIDHLNSSHLQELNALQTRLDKNINTYLKSAKTKDSELNIEFIYRTKPDLFQHQVMLYEWRVSLFAQHLRTQFAISKKRIEQHWQSMEVN